MIFVSPEIHFASPCTYPLPLGIHSVLRGAELVLQANGVLLRDAQFVLPDNLFLILGIDSVLRGAELVLLINDLYCRILTLHYCASIVGNSFCVTASPVT